MRKVLTYDISELVPYINWLYFFHAWGLSGKPQTEKDRMQREALAMLESWEGKFHTHAVFCLLDANSDGDDILVYPPKGECVRIPMLRQQKPSSSEDANLCLADFVRPLHLNPSSNSAMVEKDRVGIFCATVDGAIVDMYRKDDYQSMLVQTLCDRLAEATAEKMHEQVRRIYWGYAPDEQLTMEQTHREEYQGIRPAVGYPSIPDTSVNFIIDNLLDMKEVNVRLTETGMMTPHASVSGFMFAHPKSHYFEVGKVGEDQLRDYAHRRGIPVEVMRRFLLSSLMKK